MLWVTQGCADLASSDTADWEEEEKKEEEKIAKSKLRFGVAT